MNISSETSEDLYFLLGGGEMGELIRQKDWSKTALGDPKDWPQSLRTTVALMLDNPFAMYIAWGEEYIQLYNDGYRPILGDLKHPHALGISSNETFSEIWHIIESMFADVMKGIPVGFPDFMLPLNRNGFVEECYFDFSYSPIRKDNGEVGGILVTVIETTNRKKVEIALKESEARFRAMADNIPNLAWMADADGNIFWYNKQWYNYTGTTLEEMQGWGWQSVHDPEELPKVLVKWKESIDTGLPFEMVFPIKGVNGNYRQFLTRVLPVYNEEGIIYQWFGTNTDITERIESEERYRITASDLTLAKLKIQESEKNLRHTILHAPVAMCILKGPEHVVELANERMFELWGKASYEILNKPIFEGLPEAKDQGFEALLDGVYNTGKAFSATGVPINLPRNNSIETVYVNFLYEAYRETGGNITGILAVAVEVTAEVIAKQEIEKEVAKRTKELAEVNIHLQKSNAELEQFAYVASHDLQEPLRKIQVFTNLLESYLSNDSDEKSRNYINKIYSSTSRMKNLISDVLSYSQLENKALVFQQVDLNEIVRDLINDYELLIAQKKATIIYKDLPVIEAVPLQMAQLFGNIIGNALKFTREGIDPVVTISVSKLNPQENAKLSEKLTYINLQIRDNGIGFEEGYSEKIFNIFQRLHARSEFEGTGIGLAMCKKIVLNHMGDINALGSSSKGAVFNITLPVQRS